MRSLFPVLRFSDQVKSGFQRSWLPALLMAATLLIATLSGKWIAEGMNVVPLYLLIGGASLTILVIRPDLILFLIPILLTLPRTIPRLFGFLGVFEVFLPLAGMACIVNIASTRRKVIWMDKFLALGLLAAVPIIGSALVGRGDQDLARAITWLAGLIVYFLALNLAIRDRRIVERALFWTAVAVVFMLWFNFLAYAQLDSLADIRRFDTIYRKSVTSLGEATLVSAILAMPMPILITYALSSPSHLWRRIATASFVSGLLLGFLLLSRAFWIALAVGLMPQSYLLWKQVGRRSLLRILLLMAVSVWMIANFMPELADLTGEKLFGMTSADLARTRASLQAIQGLSSSAWTEVASLPDVSRISLSVVQFRAALNSPVIGHGVHLETSRFAHAVFPTAFYDYGLIFVLPLLGILGIWLKRAIRLTARANHDPKARVAGPAHLGVVIVVLGTATFDDFLITSVAYICLAFFIAGLLGAVMLNVQEEREHVPATG